MEGVLAKLNLLGNHLRHPSDPALPGHLPAGRREGQEYGLMRKNREPTDAGEMLAHPVDSDQVFAQLVSPMIIAAPTVLLVCSSTMMKLPVTRHWR